MTSPMVSSQDFVATLVAGPFDQGLTDALLVEAAVALGHETERQVLASGIAADLVVRGASDGGAIERRVRDVLADRPVDVIVQPLAHRRKRLFLADMDSTMIAQECIDELADYVGLKTEVSEITERAMRGEIAFEPALRERVALLENLPVGVVDEIIAERITLTPGGPELVRTMRRNGAYTCLVSGGFTIFTGPISAKIGFHEHRSNVLNLDGEALAGTVTEPILGREAKLATLVELRERLGLASHDTMAVGDGANDLAMLEEAGLGVAFHAKPAVSAAAHARVDHGDLTALLYCQGYDAGTIARD
ncbi:phosphoserine phosphatase SerB [Microvirga pudoricolor]|uniref:phosphoserine phosphatase SerB n=1 Tax=Microvirga pudoricolor TaxID=2778729 RepID=UPI0019512BA7|nr:phosphoserine phosphatase SerB [Microvirga pudoricolor]MBM6594539.1 phosphoserine phosphatase SerB [Microvirga pudoricolor]